MKKNKAPGLFFARATIGLYFISNAEVWSKDINACGRTLLADAITLGKQIILFVDEPISINIVAQATGGRTAKVWMAGKWISLREAKRIVFGKGGRCG